MRLYGWPVSPYTQKTITYLRFKGIPFTDIQPTALVLFRTIPKAVGKSIMPTIKLEDGTWLQDSSAIVEWVEARHPEPTIQPPGPRQCLAAALAELYGDEWLPMAALHYRWNVPTNKAFALSEFGRYALPWLPGFISRPIASRIGSKMASYLPVLGVTEQTIPGLESVTEALIRGLQNHLSQHRFLLGGRPCIGDFALLGPLWAHLFRDPGTTALFDAAPAVRDWMTRLLEPDGSTGEFLPDDEVPESLDFLFIDQFAEQWPHLTDLMNRIDAWLAEHPEARRIPRSLGSAPFTLGGKPGERKLITFASWKAQRVLDVLASVPESQRDVVAEWLAQVRGEALLTSAPKHRQKHENFKLVLA